MTSDLAIDVHGLDKAFQGKFAVQNVSMQVRRAEIFGFLGPNGSGKTTTIRMLCGLLQPDAGTGTCLGYDIMRETDKIRRLVGYMPQMFSLYKDLTIKENLLFIAQANTQHNYRQRVEEIISELHLTHYQNTLAGNLSGGWKQELSLGAALLNDPKLLLLDEPTAGIDPKARRDFWNYIAHLTTQDITVLVSTHYMDEAERCNRLAYMIDGHLIIQGTIPEIRNKVGLISAEIHGDNLVLLANNLADKSGIEQITPWGNLLRICVKNSKVIQELIALYPNFTWEIVDASLEEILIYLTKEVKK